MGFTFNVISVAKELNPKFIAILGSPVPMLIGTDFKGISTEIENNLNIHVMGFNTTGLSYYNTGIEMAGVELIKRFSNENVEKTVNSVNLIGATPLDFNDLKNIQSIESFFEDTDIKINSKLFMNLPAHGHHAGGVGVRQPVHDVDVVRRLLQQQTRAVLPSGVPVLEIKVQ